MQRHISKHSFELVKGMTDVMNAATRFQVIANELDTRFKSKDMLNGYVNRLNFIIKDFKSRCTPEMWSIIENDALNDEQTLQIDGIVDMLLDMPKGMKDQIEKHIESLYNVYRLNNE